MKEDGALDVLNDLIKLLFRVESPEWQVQEKALLQIGRIVAPWLFLDFYKQGVAEVWGKTFVACIRSWRSPVRLLVFLAS